MPNAVFQGRRSPANRLGFAVFSLFVVAALLTPVSLAAQTANPLLEMLKSPNADTRARAARDIGKSGERSAIPALAEALKDPSEKVRREVVIALANFRQPEALDPLITATRDSDSDTRVYAIEGLVGNYTGQTPSPGFTGFMKRGYRRARSHFVTDTLRIDPGTWVEPKVIAALDAAMQDTSSIEAARQAAKGLGTLMARSAIPDLVKSAHSLDPDLAREALNALAKIKDTAAGPGLVDLLDSPNLDVKRDAAVTVGLLRARTAQPKLQSMFEKDPDKKTREAALEGLADLGDPAADPVFVKALSSEDKRYRALGAEGLGRAGDLEAAPEIDKALSLEKNAEAKLAMEYALTALGQENHFGPLVDALASALHSDSAEVYLIELSQNRKFLPKLYPYLNSQDATVRKRLCTVLVFTGDQTSLDPLQRLAHDKDSEVASEAYRALRAIRARGATSAAATSAGVRMRAAGG